MSAPVRYVVKQPGALKELARQEPNTARGTVRAAALSVLIEKGDSKARTGGGGAKKDCDPRRQTVLF